MTFFFNSRCSKIYPCIISFVAVKNCAHRQTNQPQHVGQLSGPKPPKNFDNEERCNFRALMKEAAKRAQRLLAAEAAKYHIPGISYSVALDEADPFVSTYGFADMENNKQLQNTSVLRIGYITMLYTAFLALEMSAISGRIQVEDSIETVLFGFPDKIFQLAGRLQTAHSITMDGILCHKSGLKDYSDAELKSVKRENLDMILEKEVDNQTPLAALPGTYSFARYPYMLISILLREVYHASYSVALADSMNNLYGLRPWIFTDNTIDVIKGLSRHYQRNIKGILQPATYVNPANREAIYGLVARPDVISCFGLKLVRNTKDNKDGKYKGNLQPEHAQYMFQPLTDDPTFDSHSGEIVYPCVLGRLLYTEDGSRTPTAWCSSSVIGSSSILLVKGFLLNPACRQAAMLRAKQSRAEISVSVLCNLEGVELYSVANRIAGVYQEALHRFHDWRESHRRERLRTNATERKACDEEGREQPCLILGLPASSFG